MEKELSNNELQQKISQEIYDLKIGILFFFLLAFALLTCYCFMISRENQYIIKMLETTQQQQEQTIKK